MIREPVIAPLGTTRYVDTVDGLRLQYLEYGASGERGCRIIVVPGITSPAITWEFVAEELARHARVVVLDVRGRGLSDRGARGSYSLPSYASDVASLVRSAGGECPIVFGHSMGARIVATFGALYANLASALIVCDPPLTGPGRDPYPTPLESFMTSIELARAGATAADMRPYFPTWTDAQLALRADWLVTCDPDAVRESYENFESEDFFAYWRQVSGPLLFLYGKESPVVPEGALREIVQANRAANVAGVPDAGHMIPWDNLEGFLVEVRRFVDSVGGAG